MLRAAGEVKVKVKRGRKNVMLHRNAIVASAAWELLSGGQTELPNGTKIKLNPRDWLDLFKFVHVHTDGPVRAEVDITSGGQPLKAFVGFSPDEWDALPTVNGTLSPLTDDKS